MGHCHYTTVKPHPGFPEQPGALYGLPGIFIPHHFSPDNRITAVQRQVKGNISQLRQKGNHIHTQQAAVGGYLQGHPGETPPHKAQNILYLRVGEGLSFGYPGDGFPNNHRVVNIHKFQTFPYLLNTHRFGVKYFHTRAILVITAKNAIYIAAGSQGQNIPRLSAVEHKSLYIVLFAAFIHNFSFHKFNLICIKLLTDLSTLSTENASTAVDFLVFILTQL
jgi:hypothetical protein